MYSLDIDDFNITQITNSGQCFQMNYIENNSYSIIAFNKYIEVYQNSNTFVFSCDEEEYNKIWKDYFDIETDYSLIKQAVNKENDTFLNNAIKFGQGIRILKQDLWETIITFIISQRKSIPSIKRCINNLCFYYGDKLIGEGFNDNVIYYSFPSPEILKDVSLEELRVCGLGYRDIYVHDAAIWCNQNLELIDYKYIASKLKNIYTNYIYAKNTFKNDIEGIGNKIANCICLFSLHQLEACPIDVHMQKIIDYVYSGIIPNWMVNCYAGVYQQYAFYYNKTKKGWLLNERKSK